MEYIDEARNEYARADYAAAAVSEKMANMENLERIADNLLEIDMTLQAILKALTEGLLNK